ncbi:hypothetical protein RAS2_28290 [Phycisphaerae bacterium RAS2]|nr:hypothetical protein RAS2_28290 [Phycisphaerae bacterium RAS2]
MDAASALPETDAPRRVDDGLAMICRAWTSLPEAVRAGIVGMVRAFTGAESENTANRQRDGGEDSSEAAREQA